MKIHNELKSARQKAQLKQEEIAATVKISVITYHRYESGQRIPNVYIAIQLAEALNSTVEDIFTPQQQHNNILPEIQKEIKP